MNFRWLSLLLGVLIIGSVGRAVEATKPPDVSQITVQRTQCYGTCPVDSVTFRADGSATYAGWENAPRQGFYRGELKPHQFADLVTFLDEQNYFELRDEIGAGLVTDVPEFLVGAVRDGHAYNVTFHVDGNPALAAKMRRTLLSAAENIQWKRDEIASASGVRGTARRPLTPRETRIFRDRKPPIEDSVLEFGQIWLRSLDHPEIELPTRSDQEGRFQFFAPPGRYELWSQSSTASELRRRDEILVELPRYYVAPQKIEVEAGKFAAPTLNFVDINTARFEK